ncbi:uncharacterized protein LOC100279121 precursor [Zea mays]|uniref:EGF-like domain-containing protein n=1 Tax=Zea mays TaxID=4577 RepID=B6UHZ6_MAIZE|nr:uncharacterized protein LOC100279121 precursor [Zea mays]ACG48979.1 hypothetical protein [Zea mays]ONM06348.1 hypothetical protein ZEAMMB73_Zm00001d032929 [Zea mays]|eukprot:NP_001145634.1 uncharacterized protein LOC100279121 precursor [Zea mays]
MAAVAMSPDLALFLTALLLLALAGARPGAAATTDSSTICDTAECGKGTCSEVPGILPVVMASYKCTCDPGWSQPKLLNLTVLPFMPCIIPDCTFDSSCYNFSLFSLRGIPLTDPCVIIDCGLGECRKGQGFSYTCECQPGYVNFLDQTYLPCVKNCSFGSDCSKQGIAPPPAPPPSTASPPAHGSVSSWRLLQLLLPHAILLLLLL